MAGDDAISTEIVADIRRGRYPVRLPAGSANRTMSRTTASPSELEVMRVGVEFGRNVLDVEVPAGRLIELDRAPLAAPLPNPADAVRTSLENPDHYPSLRRALTPDDHVTLVVDERLPGLASLVIAVLDHVTTAGVADDAVTILTAGSGLAQNWIDELPDSYGGVKLELHNPADRKRLAYLATTQAGRRVYLNRSAVEADQLVVLARMHFDPMHGYAGAAELIYPALSDVETRRAWEKALTNEPPGEEPWPARREAEEILWLLGAPFLIHAVPGRGDEIVQVIAGAGESATLSRAALDRQWRATAKAKADLVVASISGNPSDHGVDDMAQAAASASRVVAPGGTILVMTDERPELGEGLRRAGEYAGPAAALSALHAQPTADYPTAYQWLRAASQHRIVLWSGLTDDESESIFSTRLESPRQLQRLIDAADSSLFLPDAHQLLATVASEE